MSKKVVCFDTETTGTFDTDEILQIAIVDDNGKVILDTKVKPKHHKRWDDAEKVHGITVDDVKDLPTIDEYADLIKTTLENADEVVGYNVKFDIKMLEQSGVHVELKNMPTDVMMKYKFLKQNVVDEDWYDPIAKKKIKEPIHYQKRNRLIDCAKDCNYTWVGTAHGALADTLATIYCYKDIRKKLGGSI